MKVVPWICAAAASVLSLSGAHADGGGLTADASRVPWATFQSRIGYAPGAPGWRADLAPPSAAACRSAASACSATSISAPTAPAPGVAGIRLSRHQRRSDRRAQRSTRVRRTGSTPSADRRLFGASAAVPVASIEPDRRQRHPSLRGHRLQQPLGQERLELQRRPRRRLAEPRQRWCASAASSVARKASTTSSATCAWRRWSSSASLFLLNRSPGVSR